MEDIEEELSKLPTLDAIYPLLDKESKIKNLELFVFEYEELKRYFTPRFKEVALVTLAKSKENAIWNMQNYKHSYLVRLINTDAEALNKV